MLAQKVELAESDAQIYIQISEKMLEKKAKQVWNDLLSAEMILSVNFNSR